MAFPAVRSSNESSTNSAGTTHTLNYPATISAGDTLLILLGKGSTAATMNAVTDWNELVDENAAWGGFVAWKKATGSETGTIAFTSSANTKSASVMYAISGAADPTVTPPEISTVATGTSNAPNPTTCTPTGGAKDYKWITFFILGAAGEEADDDTWCNNAATNYSGLLQKTSGTAGTNIGAYIASCNRDNNAASEDASWPSGSTDGANTWRAWTVALHPAPPIVSPPFLTKTLRRANLRYGPVALVPRRR